MDKNKAIKLKQIGYQIRHCCHLCIFKDIEKGKEWGTCKVHQYKHEKHTDSVRQLSIHIAGCCPRYMPSRELQLHAFKELLEDEEDDK